MSQCTTTHGPYRCKHAAGHGGDCEADDMSGHARRQIPLGPYHNAPELTRAYVRGIIDFGPPYALDMVGGFLGVERGNGEPDCEYRPRLTRAL